MIMQNLLFMKKKLLFLAIMPLTLLSSERDINHEWCLSIGGYDEYRTKNGTYVDCLTKDYAIEAEYDYNWKEAIGQALHYADATDRKPGILLIKRKKSNKDYHSQLMHVIKKYDLPIEIFVTELNKE
jgi:hypothetical protein